MDRDEGGLVHKVGVFSETKEEEVAVRDAVEVADLEISMGREEPSLQENSGVGPQVVVVDGSSPSGEDLCAFTVPVMKTFILSLSQ